jgi:uncharacterized protein
LPGRALAALLLAGILGWSAGTIALERLAPVSKLGTYEGYSVATYDGWSRTSAYVAMRDGVRLAVDVYRPTGDSAQKERKLPVLCCFERYHRARLESGKLSTPVNSTARLQTLLRHGYALAFADIRGTGASFGVNDGPFAPIEAQDAYDVVEWLAAEPWCDGHVGLIGRSYSGIIQYLAAAECPPHLDAIFPEMALFDLYSFAYPGGIMRRDFGRHWSELVRSLDLADFAAPVDADPGARERAAATREHGANRYALELLEPLPFRSALDAETGEAIYATRNPARAVAALRNTRIATYHLAGWNDMWPKDALLWLANMGGPQKIVIGPWSHGDTASFSRLAEQQRWFDRWLKGTRNGVDAEARIHYYTIGAPAEEAWRSADLWPIPEAVETAFFAQPAAATLSQSRGGLGPLPGAAAVVELKVDPTATSGRSTRWAAGYGTAFARPDLTAADERAVTFTTAPLAEPTEVTGHPIVRLWARSRDGDFDVIAYLEDVDGDGRSLYVSEGCLRASHRPLATAPFEMLGLPFHDGNQISAQSVGPEPIELVFDLHPTSYIFERGHHMRLMLAGADCDNLISPRDDAAQSLEVLCGGERATRLLLPVVPRSARPAAVARPHWRAYAGGASAAGLAMLGALSLRRRRRCVG